MAQLLDTICFHFLPDLNLSDAVATLVATGKLSMLIAKGFFGGGFPSDGNPTIGPLGLNEPLLCVGIGSSFDMVLFPFKFVKIGFGFVPSLIGLGCVLTVFDVWSPKNVARNFDKIYINTT